MHTTARVLRPLGLVTLLLALSTPLSAQVEQGRLLGTAKDAQGGVLPGVTVTATSPALIGQRTAVTETDGRYLITNLPSGTYALKFELQGFQPFVRQNIVVTQGSTLTVDTTLEVASLSESITVTGDSPMVDTTTTKVGATFSGEALVGVPRKGNDISIFSLPLHFGKVLSSLITEKQGQRIQQALSTLQ